MAGRMKAVFSVGMLAALAGCSGSSELGLKPDSTLTYDVVARDVPKHRGKRVRWQGQFANGTVKDKTFGKGSALDAVFVDTRTDSRVDLLAFAVQAESEKGNVDLMFQVQGRPVWVIGTVAGLQHTKMTVGPPPEERERLPEEIAGLDYRLIVGPAGNSKEARWTLRRLRV